MTEMKKPTELEQRILDMYEENGSVYMTAKKLGKDISNTRKVLQKFGAIDPQMEGRTMEMPVEKRGLPEPGSVKRYIITAAQNNTTVFRPFFENLLAYADEVGAEIMVSRFTYNKAKFGEKAVKPDSGKGSDVERLWYAKELTPYFTDHPIQLAPGIVFWGNMNTLPTTVNPLAGYQTHGGRKSGIFPHARQEMRSIATMKHEGAKFQYTTGCVTNRNYIQKNAGIKAEFHHVFGALLIEVTSAGDWFVRQLNADSRGSFYDLDAKVQRSQITFGHRPEAINPGDIHADEIDPVVRDVTWGEDGIIDTLRPKKQFWHDLFSMRAQNHHEKHDFHTRLERFMEGNWVVEEELERTTEFAMSVGLRPWIQTFVVRSNHDQAFERWLRDDPGCYAKDPLNAEFFLEAQLAKVRAIKTGDKSFKCIEWGMKKKGLKGKIKFLDEDVPFIICRSKGHGGIEMGGHGHRGPNGSRGSAASLCKIGRRQTIGHMHTCGIYSGLFVAGTCSDLDLGYNVGPSSWSHSHVLTYPNGKRVMLTLWKGQWRADEDGVYERRKQAA